MAVTLSPLVGTGSGDDPFRVPDATAIIDLRADATAVDGWALALLPDGAEPLSGAEILSNLPLPDAAQVRLPRPARNRLANRLGLEVADDPLGRMVLGLLLSGDDRARGVRTKWRPLRPSRRRRRYEVWLGGLLWQMPVIAGGATLTETWTGTSDGTNIDGDQTWTKVLEDSGAGSWQLDSERLLLESAVENFNLARAEADLDGADHYVEAEVEFESAGTNGGGVCARFDSAAQTCYVGKASPRNAAAPWMSKYVAGSQSLVASTSNTVAAGTYTIRLEADGSSLTCSVTGFTDLGATDTDITGGIRWGAYGRSRGTSDRHWWDSFTAEDLGAAAETVTLAGTLPALTGSATIQASADAQLAGTLPALTADFSVAAEADVQLGGTLPALTGSFTITEPGVESTYISLEVGPMREPLQLATMREPLQVGTMSSVEPVTVGAIRDTTPTVGVLRDDSSPTVGVLREPLTVDTMRDPLQVDELRE